MDWSLAKTYLKFPLNKWSIIPLIILSPLTFLIDFVFDLLIFIQERFPEGLENPSEEQQKEILLTIVRDFPFPWLVFIISAVSYFLFLAYSFVVTHNCIKFSESWDKPADAEVIMKFDFAFFKTFLKAVVQTFLFLIVLTIVVLILSLILIIPILLTALLTVSNTVSIYAIITGILTLCLFLLYLPVVLCYMTTASLLFYRDLNSFKMLDFPYVYKCIRACLKSVVIIAIANTVISQIYFVSCNLTIEILSPSLWKIGLLLTSIYSFVFVMGIQGHAFNFLDKKLKEKGL